MNTPATSLRYRLVNDATVTALVGTRVYPAALVPPDATLPFGTIQQVSRREAPSLTSSTNIAWTIVQVDWYARHVADSETLAEAARLELDGFRGTVTVDGNALVIQNSTLENQISDIDAELGEAKEERYSRITQEFEVAHEIAVP